MSGDAPRVLLAYRTLGLGDLLTAVPALRALRRAFPEHRLALATPGWLGPLVGALDAVDVHLATPELAVPDVSPATVDVAVNLHGRGPQSHRLLATTRPARLVAYHHPAVPATADAPRWRDDEHEVARWCRLLAGHDIACDPSDLDLAPPPGPVPRRWSGATVVHPGAKAPARRWPVERFAAVARHERRSGRHVLVTGSAAEAGPVGAVVRRAGLPDDAALAGTLDVGALARLVAGAGRVVCGDTGVAHLATAVGTPSVVLFGPVSPAAWGPPPQRRDRHRVLWAGRRGDPHGGRLDPGLAAIDVDEVVAALDGLADRAG